MQRKYAIAAAALVSLGSIGLTVQHRTDRAWAAMQHRLDELQAERLARPTERDALYGTTTDGRAWDHYRLALDATQKLGDLRERGHHIARARTEEDRQDRDALLLEASAALDHLRRGAHARDAATAASFPDGMAARIPKLVDTRALAQIACAQFMALHEAGNDIEGVHSLLDMHQLARDLMASPILIEEMIGVAYLVPDCVGEFLESEGGSLSIEAKALWLDALDQLAETQARESYGFAGEVELFGRELCKHANREDTRISRLSFEPGWRYGFSWRVAGSDYVLRGSDWAEDIARAYQLEPQLSLAALREQEGKVDADPNPLIGYSFPKARSAASSRLWGRTKLSFLRHALALDLGRTPCEPLDAFGYGVEVEVQAGRICVQTDTSDDRRNQLRITLRTE